MIELRMANPVAFAENLLGFYPDPIQARILTAAAWRGLINCSRQWGKSTIMAIKALFEALAKDGTVVLVLCPSFHQAGEFFENLRTFLNELGIRPRSDGHNRISVRLPNGSRIIGLSGRSKIRSYRHVSLLLVDEAAEVPEAAYCTIRPALATSGEFGGKIWMMSTPQGRQGMFWHAWENEGDRWTRFTVPATQCPRIAPAFLEEERSILGERVFAQEYLCRFIEAPDCILNREDVYRSIRTEIPGIWH